MMFEACLADMLRETFDLPDPGKTGSGEGFRSADIYRCAKIHLKDCRRNILLGMVDDLSGNPVYPGESPGRRITLIVQGENIGFPEDQGDLWTCFFPHPHPCHLICLPLKKRSLSSLASQIGVLNRNWHRVSKCFFH
jgi:hypothetical protein